MLKGSKLILQAMSLKLSGWSDTIVALATPPGVGAIGKAFQIINQLFPSKDLLLQPSHTLHVGILKNGGTPLDEAVVSLYKAPLSMATPCSVKA